MNAQTDLTNSSGQSRRWSTSALFWLSLLTALAGMASAYRSSDPPPGECATALFDSASAAAIALPLRINPGHAPDRSVLLEHRFNVDLARVHRPALYLGEAAPYAQLRLNGRDLTPEIDPGPANRRDLAPRLHALPIDALLHGGNRLILRMPVSAALSETRVSTLCIGEYAALREFHQAGWWRRLGVPLVCLVLCAVLCMGMLGLWRLDRRAPYYLWYIACVLLVACRTTYVVMNQMPGGVQLWRMLNELSVVLLLYAVYRLLCRFWGIGWRRWTLAWVVAAATLRLLALPTNWVLDHPHLDALFWFACAGVAVAMVVHVALSSRYVPTIERIGAYWAILFAIGCGVLEALTYRLAPEQSLVWLYTPGSSVTLLVFGFLLARRAILGSGLLHHATRMLRRDLNRALLPGPDRGTAMWAELSDGVADGERQRMLRDIEDGFGSRMLGVLERIRREHPHSRLNHDIQRALLDLRLMIDALDESTHSVGAALGQLRHRMEGPLGATGIASEWEFIGVDQLKVNDRRELMELFRCLEELLSNVIQHAGATCVRVAARMESFRLNLSVEDDGCGLAADRPVGRGLRNVAMRMHLLDGTMCVSAGAEGFGTRIELSLPRI